MVRTSGNRRTSKWSLVREPEDVDWLRFERLLGRAREAHIAGDLAAADTMFTDAVALWRGRHAPVQQRPNS